MSATVAEAVREACKLAKGMPNRAGEVLADLGGGVALVADVTRQAEALLALDVERVRKNSGGDGLPYVRSGR